jgi:hypothetical protein
MWVIRKEVIVLATTTNALAGGRCAKRGRETEIE